MTSKKIQLYFTVNIYSGQNFRKIFKHITNPDGIFEIKMETGSDLFRAFSFFNKGNLVFLINGFQKKALKIPQSEIKLAEKLKKEYLDEK